MTTYKAIVVDEQRRSVRHLAVLLLDDEFCTRYAALCNNQPSEGGGHDTDALEAR